MTDLIHSRIYPKYEAADFYVGRGPDAELIGCMTDNGRPDGVVDEVAGTFGIDAFGMFQSLLDTEFTDEHFRAEVANLYPHVLGHWVHEWHDSRDTPWCYMYDSGTVYVYRFGVEMAQLRCNFTRSAPRREKNDDDTVTTFPSEMVRVPRDTARDKFPTMRKETAHA
jgi:hypothetical protein